jgi:hypothetical protein
VNGSDISLRPESFEAQSFDDYLNIETVWSKRLKRFYVRTKGWGGQAVYDGCDLAGKKEIVITAAAFMGSGKLTLTFADKKAETGLLPADGYDCFREYVIPLPDGLTESGRLTVTLSGDVSILGIALR